MLGTGKSIRQSIKPTTTLDASLIACIF